MDERAYERTPLNPAAQLLTQAQTDIKIEIKNGVLAGAPFSVTRTAIMILNIWVWEIFSRRENQKTVQMIISVFFVLCIGWFIYSACKKNSKNKVFSEINIYIPVFFAYSIYAILMIV